MHNKKIVIVGGGTAGWITANLFAKRWSQHDFEITLIESPNIPIIGVGEGSTPYIKNLFNTLEIAENEWMDKCNATYKNGIQFNDWSSVKGFKSYFHPFLSELDDQNIPLFEYNTLLRRQGYNTPCHPDDYFLMSTLNKLSKEPIPAQNFPFNSAYSYHFDSHLLGDFLRENALKMGVTHIRANISKVNLNQASDICSIDTDDNRSFISDLFVDCTGFKGMLIQQSLNVPFISFNDNLFNDSAIAIPSKLTPNIKPSTISTAMSAGWSWKIPLKNRVGNGYVYSSKYQTVESAEQELKDKIGHHNITGETRYLKMRVGRVKYPWYKNCLAIGLSQGFIEPLEATALHIVQKMVEEFIDFYEAGNFTLKHQETFNNKTNFDYERLRDYIVMHYVTNSRNDTQYWHDARTKVVVSDYLKSALQTWFTGKDLRKKLDQQNVSHFYSSPSWHAMLAGVGCFPSVNTKLIPPNNTDNIEAIKKFLYRCSLNYPTI